MEIGQLSDDYETVGEVLFRIAELEGADCKYYYDLVMDLVATFRKALVI